MVERTINEVEIWTRVVSPTGADMPPRSATAILGWAFNEAAKNRMEQLAERSNRGELAESELEELSAYIHVGQVIGILQAKARLSLQRTTWPSRKEKPV